MWQQVPNFHLVKWDFLLNNFKNVLSLCAQATLGSTLVTDICILFVPFQFSAASVACKGFF